MILEAAMGPMIGAAVVAISSGSMVGALPFCMLAFHRLVDAPSVLRSVVLGLLLWATAMTCAYYGIFTALMVSLGIPLSLLTARVWLLVIA